MTADVFVVHREFNAFAEFSEVVRDWNLDFRQLGEDTAPTVLIQTGDTGMQITHARLGAPCDQKGATPKGFRTFGVPCESSSEIVWCGVKKTPRSIMAFEPSGEFDCSSQPGFEVFTVSVRESDLHHAAYGTGGARIIESLNRGPSILEADLASLALLRRELQAITRAAKTPDGVLLRYLLRNTRQELLGLLCKALGSDIENELRLTASKRRKILSQSREWLREQEPRSVSVVELSQVVGVSERTLHRAFVEHFGIGPKAYLRSMRLNGVHRELKDAAPNSLIIGAVAQRWGFINASQFAADYRKLFGELPSATLRRDF